jgi:dihydrofolate reductase
MRKVILFNMATLDGFFAGPNGEIDWHHVDEEFNDFAIRQLDTIGAIIFGRVTYLGMASYWPTPQGIQDDPIVAGKMNALPKIVFSHTLGKADWNNTRLVKGSVVEEITRLKQEPGKDLFIFGSADLTSTFIQNNLIDEYRIMVNPVVLGKGQPLFKGVKDRLELKLAEVRPFKSGNVLLYYQPA